MACFPLRFALLSAFAVLALAACAAPNAGDSAPRVSAQLSLPRQLTGARIAAARAELASLKTPAGRDDAEFAGLRRSLDATLAALQDGKAVSQLPNPGKNVVSDIALTGGDGGDYSLSWSYHNVGDYGINGEVGVSDLTPLGSALNKSTTSPDWDTARAADGDENGVVSLSDLTPIGANLGAQVSGYNVYSGASADGPWTKEIEVSLGDAQPGFPKRFTVTLADPQAEYYTIAPFDATGADAINSVSAQTPALGAAVLAGSSTQDNAVLIGAAGGTLAGTAGGPLDGVVVTVPAGAFAYDVNMTLGYNDGAVTPAEGTFDGPIIELHTDFDGADGFAKPVTISAPYAPVAGELPIPFYVNPDGSGLEACEIDDVDTVNGKVTFETYHASSFVVIQAQIDNPDAEAYDTKFDPAVNGFSDGFINNATIIGAACFAQWFYRTQHTPLFPLFTGTVGPEKVPEALVIAERSYAQFLNSNAEFVLTAQYQREKMSDLQRWNLTRRIMRNSHSPVLVVPYGVSNDEEQTELLAYAYVGDDMFCYDPSFVGTTVTLHYDSATQTVNQFRGTHTFLCLGSGSLKYREPYENILADARAHFHGRTDAVIDLTGVQSGDEVTLNPYPLVGTVHSGAQLVSELFFKVNGVTTKVAVAPGGSFNVNVPVQNGQNRIFVTANSETTPGHFVPVTTTYTSEPLVLTGQGLFTGPLLKFQIEPTDPDPSWSLGYMSGTFELYARVLHLDTGQWTYFDPANPSLDSEGNGLLDAHTFVVGNASTIQQFGCRVHRTDPQLPGNQNYAFYKQTVWKYREIPGDPGTVSKDFILYTVPGTDPHWDDGGSVAGWANSYFGGDW